MSTKLSKLHFLRETARTEKYSYFLYKKRSTAAPFLFVLFLLTLMHMLYAIIIYHPYI